MLDTEISNGLSPGSNNGVFQFRGVNIAVVVCADLWNRKLLEKIILGKDADLLLVPALTTVPKEHENYGKYLWYSLVITRSREFVIPIVVADHRYLNHEKYDVGNTTMIVDPSVKKREIFSIEDFIEIPQQGKSNVIHILDLDKIDKYRQYRVEKGLLSS